MNMCIMTARIDRRRARIVQSYSPGGADSSPRLMHGQYTSMPRIECRLDRFSRFCRTRYRLTNTDTDTQADISHCMRAATSV